MFFEGNSFFQTLGQIILGLFFWIMIGKNIRVWQFNVDRTRDLLPIPEFFLVMNFTLQFIAGLGLIINYHASSSATVLIVLTILATMMFHRFWNTADPVKKNYHMLLFFNNFAIIGGLALLI